MERVHRRDKRRHPCTPQALGIKAAAEDLDRVILRSLKIVARARGCRVEERTTSWGLVPLIVHRSCESSHFIFLGTLRNTSQ